MAVRLTWALGYDSGPECCVMGGPERPEGPGRVEKLWVAVSEQERRKVR